MKVRFGLKLQQLYVLESKSLTAVLKGIVYTHKFLIV